MPRHIDSDVQINGALIVTDTLSLPSMADVAAAIGGKLPTSGGAITGNLTVSGQFSATTIANVPALNGSNVFTSTSCPIVLRPSSDPSQTTEETVTFTTSSKPLTYTHVDATSEVVSSGTGGTGTVYERNVDYTIDYPSGIITRLEDGDIQENDTVYVGYKYNTVLFSVRESATADDVMTIDSGGNIYAKSITVTVSSQSELSESEAGGDFTVQGNLTVKGNTTLGDASGNDTVQVIGSLTVNGYSVLTTADQSSIAAFTKIEYGTASISATQYTTIKLAASDGAGISISGDTLTISAPSVTGIPASSGTSAISSGWAHTHVNAADPHTQYLQKSGGTVTGKIISTYADIMVSKSAGHKSWVLHHPVSDLFVIAPSATADAGDWDWTKRIEINPNGSMTIAGNTVWHAGNFDPSTKSDTHSHPYLSSATTSTQHGYFGSVNLANSNYYLQVQAGGTLSQDRILTIDVQNASRTITIQGNYTFNQSVATTASPTFVQITSTATGTTPPFVVSSNKIVHNLNADKLDDLDASQIMNALGAISGFGVLSGCNVQAVEADKRVRVSAGIALLKNKGLVFISQEEVPITAPSGSNVILYIDSDGLLAVVSTVAPADPIITDPNAIRLARITVTNDSQVSNSDIWPYREFPTVYCPQKNVVYLGSTDNYNVHAQPGVEPGKIVPARFIIENNLGVVESNIFRANRIESGALRLTDIDGYTDYSRSDLNGLLTEKHTHHFGYCNGHTDFNKRLNISAALGQITIVSGIIPIADSVQVWINGVRQSPESYTVSNNLITLDFPLNENDDVIVDFVI